MDFFRDLFHTDFMPHGHCYLWRADVLWSNVIGDGLIALAYYAIPFLLYHFIRRRRVSARFRAVFTLFIFFILACGTTHILSIVSVWVPVYRLEGLVKMITAAISLYTAYVLLRLIPQALTLPSREDMDRKTQEIGQANQALQHKTAELESQNQFLAKLAFATYHDLREPVRGMSMNSQLLLHRYAGRLDDDGREMLHHIADEGKRMYSTVDSILNFTFLESESYITSHIDLNTVLAIVEKNLSQQIRESFASVQYDSLPAVKGNERLLIILFENLLSNSINFRSAERPLIFITATENAGYTSINITDNGVGFDNIYRERIFEIFQRLGIPPSGHRGAGLGLALCRRITEILGGSIIADSVEGRGTTITVVLPKA